MTKRADRGGGARKRQRHRLAGALADRRGATVVLDQQHRALEAGVAKPGVEIFQIRHQPRRDIGIDDGRRHTLVFAGDRRDLGRHRIPQGGRRLAHDLGHAALVRRLQIAVQKTNRDTFDVILGEPGDRVADGGFVERRMLRAVTVDALANRQPEVARHQDRRIGRAVVPRIDPDAAADLERVAEPLGTQQPDHGAGPLQQRIGGDGRSVHQQPAIGEQRRERHPHRGRRELERGERAGRRIIGPGRRLDRVDPARRIDHDDVGERAADIDPDVPRRRGGELGHAGIRTRSVCHLTTAPLNSKPASTVCPSAPIF